LKTSKSIAGDSDKVTNLSPRSISRKESFVIIAVFVLLIAGIGIFASLQYYRIIGSTHTLLNSISTQKVEQIQQWRMRHILEADETANSAEAIELVNEAVRGGNENANASLLSWFATFHRTYGYTGSMVLRPDLKIALATSKNLTIDETMIGTLKKAAESGSVVMTDLYKIAPLGNPGCNIIIPLFADRASRKRLAGYIVHFLDAESDLYPIIGSWVIPNATAENLIIRKDQNQITVLSNLKYIQDAALSFTIPADSGPTVETLAAYGARGFLTGNNYRNRKVQAIARDVNGTDWILLSEIENREITKPWWATFFLHGTILILGIAAAILSGTALLQWKSSMRYRKLLESEKKLHETESKFSVFMDHMPSMVLIKDDQSRILFANKELLSQFPADDWMGKSPEEIFDPQQAVITKAWDKKAFEEGYVDYEETRLNRAGQPRFLFTQKFVIQQDGNPPLLGQIMTDLTERNRTLRQIRELNTTLEEKVRERTAELEASNTELQAFTYSVSHDLRSPLRTLDGFADLLEKKYSSVLDEQGLHYLSRIRHGSIRMGDLIDDLLSLSKISNIEMKKEQVDIGNLANSIISEYIRKEPEHKVSISIKPSLMVSCDASLVDTLLRILIDNAFKFSKGLAQTVIELDSTRSDPAFKGRTVFSLKDNGVGFDMEYKDTLFQPFHRLHSVEEFPGNGIGLAIATRIVKRHGGAIWLESEPGKGTTAFFTLSPG